MSKLSTRIGQVVGYHRCDNSNQRCMIVLHDDGTPRCGQQESDKIFDLLRANFDCWLFQFKATYQDELETIRVRPGDVVYNQYWFIVKSKSGKYLGVCSMLTDNIPDDWNVIITFHQWYSSEEEFHNHILKTIGLISYTQI